MAWTRILDHTKEKYFFGLQLKRILYSFYFQSTLPKEHRVNIIILYTSYHNIILSQGGAFVVGAIAQLETVFPHFPATFSPLEQLAQRNFFSTTLDKGPASGTRNSLLLIFWSININSFVKHTGHFFK